METSGPSSVPLSLQRRRVCWLAGLWVLTFTELSEGFWGGVLQDKRKDKTVRISNFMGPLGLEKGPFSYLYNGRAEGAPYSAQLLYYWQKELVSIKKDGNREENEKPDRPWAGVGFLVNNLISLGLIPRGLPRSYEALASLQR